MQYFAIYLDHCQLRVMPYDPDYRARSFDRAVKIADAYGQEYGAHRVTIEDRYGAIVYQPQREKQ